jgi:hypothetical protein
MSLRVLPSTNLATTDTARTACHPDHAGLETTTGRRFKYVSAGRRYRVKNASSLVRQWRHRAKVRGFTVLATRDQCKEVVGSLGQKCDLCRRVPSASVVLLFPMDDQGRRGSHGRRGFCIFQSPHVETHSGIYRSEEQEYVTNVNLRLRSKGRPRSDSPSSHCWLWRSHTSINKRGAPEEGRGSIPTMTSPVCQFAFSRQSRGPTSAGQSFSPCA